MYLSMIEQTHPILNHVIRGQGTTVLLIHGLFGSLENLNMLARALENQYQVISIDVRNHGKSFQHPSMDYNDLANDVVHLLKSLNIDKLAIRSLHGW